MSGYDHLRTSAAERERAIDVLRAAFAEGRLDRDEYSERVGQAYQSRTYRELAALTCDLPVGPLGTAPVALHAPPLQAPPLHAPPTLAPARPPRRGVSGAAVTALVLGAAATVMSASGLDDVVGILAVTLGAIALIMLSGTGRHGRPLAIAAIVLGVLAVFFPVWPFPHL